MKRIFLSFAFATIVLTSAIAADNLPSYAVKQAFKKEFSNIKEVKWDEISGNSGIYVASFLFNNETLQAIFNEEGEFLGTTRLISKEQLPILAIKELNNYSNSVVVSIYEHNSSDGLNYFITINNEKGTQLLKVSSGGQITINKKIRK
jgi:hypothetical protein